MVGLTCSCSLLTDRERMHRASSDREEERLSLVNCFSSSSESSELKENLESLSNSATDLDLVLTLKKKKKQKQKHTERKKLFF